MKRLLFGIIVALFAFTFSAFTTQKNARFTESFYYLGFDGDYHSVTQNYNPSKCVGGVTTYCAYTWSPASSDPHVPSLTPAIFNQLINNGQIVPRGSVKGRYIP